MDSSTLTTMSRQALTDAQSEARRRSNNEVDTWHLLYALLTQEKGIVPALVEKLGLTTSAMELAAERELERLPNVSGSVDTSKIYVTQAVNDVLTRARIGTPSARPPRLPLAGTIPSSSTPSSTLSVSSTR